MKHSSNSLWILAVIILFNSCASPVISSTATAPVSSPLQAAQSEMPEQRDLQIPLQLGPDIRVDRRKSEVVKDAIRVAEERLQFVIQSRI